MLVAIVPVLAAILGLLLYLLPASGKVQEIGRLLLGAGILVTLAVLASRVVRLG